MRIEEETDIEVDQNDDPSIQIHVDKKVIRDGTPTWLPWDFTQSEELTFIVKDKVETADDDPLNQVYKLSALEIDRSDGIHGNLSVAATKAATVKARVRRYKLIDTQNARDVTVAAGKFIVRDT